MTPNDPQRKWGTQAIRRAPRTSQNTARLEREREQRDTERIREAHRQLKAEFLARQAARRDA